MPADQERKGGMESQMEVAEKAHAIIMENLERHITIAELSQMLHASPTQIKSCFHKVYGLPIYTYARSQRMVSGHQSSSLGRMNLFWKSQENSVMRTAASLPGHFEM